jgi:hypothetical protein
MRGDFSRLRFNPTKQYTAVLEQQGRVSLDADANEQCAINGYLQHAETVDVIGEYGGPVDDLGFTISVSGNQILISAGRYYVQGLMCENTHNNLAYTNQTYLINPSPSDAALLSQLQQSGSEGAIQVFLQVWQRLVTALDDPCLREPALGQADTTARLQTVWRVVANFVSATTTKVATPAPAPAGSVAAVNAALETRATLAAAATSRLSATAAKLNLTQSAASAATSAATAAAATGTPSAGATASAATVDCCAQMYEQRALVSTGTMAAMTSPASTDCSCQPVPAAGYQGLENQLYRIEIHQGGSATKATFKWSRENGSVVAAILSISGPTVWVNSLGPDANLGFQPNDWVEISDDTYLFGQTPNQPGTLYQILSVDPTGPSITLTTPATSVDPTRNARVRRWDQFGSSASSNGVPLAENTWQTLENGIQVNFGPGTYQNGDYWTIPARAASGQIDWPPCGGNGNLFQSPTSITVFNAPLACIHWDTTLKQTVIESCQQPFSPLTDLAPEVAPTALHVTNYSWANDDVTTFDVLLSNGLTVTLDTAPTGPITGANFIVTVEAGDKSFMPEFFNREATTVAIAPQATTASVTAATAPAATPPAAATLAAPVADVAKLAVPAAVAAAPVAATPIAAAPIAAAPIAAVPVTTLPITTLPIAATPVATTAAPGSIAINSGLLSSGLVNSVFATNFTPLYQVVPLSAFILDWQTTVNTSAKQIVWGLPKSTNADVTALQSRTIASINSLLGTLAPYGIYARVRLRLMGKMIFAQSGNTQNFLDGESFGQQATRQDGKTPCVALQMPSGNSDKASDFDGWFYLAPYNNVSSLSMNYSTFTVVVNANNVVTGVTTVVTPGTPPTTVTAQVTVSLIYPAVMANGVTVNLSLAAVTANVTPSSFVTLAQTSLVIPQGSSSGVVNINVVGNPGVTTSGTTTTPVSDVFQITANVQLAYGSPDSQSVTFTLTGAQPPVVIQ